MSKNYFLPLIDFRNSRHHAISCCKKVFSIPKHDELGTSLIMRKNQIIHLKGECNEQDSKFLIQKYYQPLTLPKKSDKNQAISKKHIIIKKDAFRNFINFQQYKEISKQKHNPQQSNHNLNTNSMSHNKIQRYLHSENSEKILTGVSSEHYMDIKSLQKPKYKSAVKIQLTSQQNLQEDSQINANQKHCKDTLLKISQIKKYKGLLDRKASIKIVGSISQNPQNQSNNKNTFQKSQQKIKQKVSQKKKTKYLKHHHTQFQQQHIKNIQPYRKKSLKFQVLGGQKKHVSFQNKQLKQHKKQTHYGIGPWAHKTKDNFIKIN